jgi:hypothetical protein
MFLSARVELEEDDATKTDSKDSDATRYNSAALPAFNSTEVVGQFSVGYYQDPRSLQFDLTKVSLRFPARFLTFASCLKHLEVTGRIVPGEAQKAAAATTTTTTTTTTVPPLPALDEEFISPRFGGWEPYGKGRNPGETGTPPHRGWGSGGFNSGSGSGSSSGGYNPGYGGGSGSGQGGYNPGQGGSGSGQGGYNPGGGSSGGGYGQGGSGGYNPGTTTTTRRPWTTTPGWGYNPGGRPPTDRPGGGWSYTSTARPSFVSTTTTTRPGFGSYNPGTGGGAGGGYNPGGYNQGGYNPGGWGGRSAFSNQFLRMSKPPSTQVKIVDNFEILSKR